MQRSERITRLGAQVDLSDVPDRMDLSDRMDLPERPWPQPVYAIVCSRLGRDLERRRCVFDYLQRATLLAKRDGAGLLVVAGTAPEPWVRRAGELFGVPVVELTTSGEVDRDRLLVAAPERVFAIWVRRRGKVAELLRQRCRLCRDESTWVAVNDQDAHCAARPLMSEGAVGWFLTRCSPPPVAVPAPPAGRVIAADAIDWSRYLVHCTRGRSGPLAAQSLSQYRDEVLLGGDGGRPATAAETLRKILSDGWLRGGARVTRHDIPVVCWTQVPLPQWLARRTFRSHLGRWDGEPYGIAVLRSLATSLGIQPVIYGESSRRERLPAAQQWRFQACGRVDWREEKEWRCRGSLELAALKPEDAVVFVGHAEDVAATAALSRWPVVPVDTFLKRPKRVQ